ncbi:MAG: DUF3667 domain-containing protein [Nonlabens sp.]
MERVCKNCGELVYANKKYCGSCGAKWVENRITMRNVASDFSDMYLGFDNRFLRTFIDLATKPSIVINGYINGTRNRYIDAVRFFLISVFVAGLNMLLMKKLDVDFVSMMDQSELEQLGYNKVGATRFIESMNKAFEFMTEYQGLIMILTIPIYALVARLVFWNRKKFYNFTEQIVFNLYAVSWTTVINSIASIIIILVNPNTMLAMSGIFLPFQILYIGYCYHQVFGLTIGQIILRTFKFIFIILSIYIALIVATGLIVVTYYKITSA